VLTIAVLPFESNAAAQDVAPGVAALLASRLAESPRLKVLTQRDIDAVLGAERQRVLLGDKKSCSEGPCLQALSSVVGARYVLSGRVDRIGERYLVTSSLVDTVRGQNLGRPSAESRDTESLLRDIGTVAEQLLAQLEPSKSAPPASAEGFSGGPVVGLRINNSFISRLASLNPGADVELGYAFHPEWVGFVQVGLSFVRSDDAGREGRLNVLPSVVGLRHYHNLESAFQPYWGFGLGVQLSFGDFGIFQSTGPLPTVTGFFGAEYRIGRHVGVQLEAGTNVAQAVLGLAGQGLGDGINLDLNAGLSYHF
jgi:TolB-like protein